jgi:hypothetical protein
LVVRRHSGIREITVFSEGIPRKTTELIIFIKPTIVSNAASEEAFAKTVIQWSRFRSEIDRYDRTSTFFPGIQFSEFTFADPTVDHSKVFSKGHGPRRNDNVCTNKVCQCTRVVSSKAPKSVKEQEKLPTGKSGKQQKRRITKRSSNNKRTHSGSRI